MRELQMHVQIIGAGSAGCHAAKACLREDHKVNVYDTDKEAYDRFLRLYAMRYNEVPNVSFEPIGNDSDLYIVATPPVTHRP